MAWTTTDLAKIEAAIAKGVTQVSFRDRTVQFRSLDEMRSIRRDIQAELGQVNNGGITYQTPYHSKGLC